MCLNNIKSGPHKPFFEPFAFIRTCVIPRPHNYIRVRAYKRRAVLHPILNAVNDASRTSFFYFRFVFFTQIENDPNLLPNVSLVLKWDDTHGETVHATKTISKMICDKVAVFFGPEGNTCYTEAIVAQAWNIPMISYVSTLHYDNSIIVIRCVCVINMRRWHNAVLYYSLPSDFVPMGILCKVRFFRRRALRLLLITTV